MIFCLAHCANSEILEHFICLLVFLFFFERMTVGILIEDNLDGFVLTFRQSGNDNIFLEQINIFELPIFVLLSS